MISDALKRLRKRKKLRQGEVAELTGISTSAMSEYESGDKIPRLDKLTKLAEFYGVTVAYFYK